MSVPELLRNTSCRSVFDVIIWDKESMLTDLTDAKKRTRQLVVELEA